jgi:hypothetical protein
MDDLFSGGVLEPILLSGERRGSGGISRKRICNLSEALQGALKRGRSPHWRFACVDTITWDHSCWQNVAS